jgi:hypothetical protein
MGVPFMPPNPKILRQENITQLPQKIQKSARQKHVLKAAQEMESVIATIESERGGLDR